MLYPPRNCIPPKADYRAEVTLPIAFKLVGHQLANRMRHRRPLQVITGCADSQGSSHVIDDNLRLIRALLPTASNIEISVHYMVNSILSCLELLISKVSERVGPSRKRLPETRQEP